MVNSLIRQPPIIIKEFKFKDKKFVIQPEFVFEVHYDKKDGWYHVSESVLSYIAIHDNKKDIRKGINEFIRMLWVEYALEEDTALSPNAIKLKISLLSRISEKF